MPSHVKLEPKRVKRVKRSARNRMVPVLQLLWRCFAGCIAVPFQDISRAAEEHQAIEHSKRKFWLLMAFTRNCRPAGMDWSQRPDTS